MLLNQFSAQSNLPAEEAVETPELSSFNGFSAGRERKRLDNVLGGLIIYRMKAVRAALAALLGAGA